MEEKESSLNIGNQVCLNSGGPIMTVVEVGETNFGPANAWREVAHCQWFADNLLQEGDFLVSTLIVVG
jgi:uncharacterized protein YodC (DUF2158 family)